MPDPSPSLVALLPGSPGRWPFAGHVRGRALHGDLSLAWAGRVGGSLPPEDAWEGAEALREALRTADVAGASRAADPARAASDVVWAALRSLPAALLAREDLSFLLVGVVSGRAFVTGCGLETVLAETPSGWVSAALAGAPLLTEPGLPASPAPPQPPHRSGARYLGVPPGIPMPAPDRIELVCGVHR